MNVSNDSNKYVIDGNTRSASMKVPPLEGLSDSYYPSEQHFTENYPKNVQNNNQYYNNQQYIQVVYPPQNDHNLPKQDYNGTRILTNYQSGKQLPEITNVNEDRLLPSVKEPKNKNVLQNTSKFIKIARKNYEEDQNQNFSFMQKKYYDRSFEDNEEEEYIYLYKDTRNNRQKSGTVNNNNNGNNHNNNNRNGNESPDTSKIEIFNLNNQVNVLKQENYFLNQRVYELSMEIQRLQRLNMQFHTFPRLEDLYSKQGDSVNTFDSTYDVTRANRLILPEIKQYNVQNFIDNTMKELNYLQ